MNLPIAPSSAAILGVATAATIAIVPAPMLGELVMESGLPALLPAAEPPLGITARALLALGVGGLVALFSWFAAFLLVGSRSIGVGKGAREAAPEIEEKPAVRRADAHPDAPPRPPLRATRDLGTPFLEVTAKLRKGSESAEIRSDEIVEILDLTEAAEAQAVAAPAPVAPPSPAEAELPEDLNQPMAQYDPGAIREAPIAAPSSVLPLRRPSRPAVFEPQERFETFELTPQVRAAPPPSVPASGSEFTRPETDASIHALLDRLEKGVVRRGLGGANDGEPSHEPEHGLQEALVTLRNLARRA
ncbi:hypothetical protein [Stakelama tenebrarum]|uniref:Uncharacterized protein n=1 Tax=Stakelama tenebrarum TaxID=2711215 RepID=A0A6G6Y855_9SPHN|nr:hypothetical protein [Sphingosinithalassobacter tenebrarum]QIG81100.1 hypothetical protein G5C33_15785 [Sphingosinithalassobacter tenebrarum]